MRGGITLLLGLIFSPALAAEARFGSPLAEGGWQLKESRIECRLSQNLPGLGQAAFVRRAGGETVFELAAGARRPAGEAQLTSLPPPWNYRSEPRDLGRSSIGGGGSRLELPPADAARLFMEMERGFIPMVGFRDQTGEWIEVLLSPVRSAEAMQGYKACGSGLLKQGFGAVRESRIVFPVGVADMPESGPARLADVAEYVAADPTVSRVVIDAATEPTGNPESDRQLADDRLETTRSLLVAGGVEERLIETRVLPPKVIKDPLKRLRQKQLQPPEERRVTITLHR